MRLARGRPARLKVVSTFSAGYKDLLFARYFDIIGLSARLKEKYETQNPGRDGAVSCQVKTGLGPQRGRTVIFRELQVNLPSLGVDKNPD